MSNRYGIYDGLEYKERLVKRQTDYVSRNFHKSDGYDEVTLIKLDMSEVADMPIITYNTTSDGVKRFLNHPEHPIVKGDIIDHVDGFKYLTTEQANHFSVNNFGKIRKMEDTLNWKDSNGNVRSHPFHMPKSSAGMQDTDNDLPLSIGRRDVWMQYNVQTATIYENQRFILGGRNAFKVTAYDNFSIVGVLRLSLERDVLYPEDDLVNNIAYNGETFTTQTPSDGAFFSSPVENNSVYVYGSGATYDSIYTYADSVIVKPEIKIPISMSEKVEVYTYLENIRTADTFTFRIDGIDPSKYTILSTDGNSVEIRCDEFYYSGQLVAIKNVTLEETSIPLVLKSLF